MPPRKRWVNSYFKVPCCGLFISFTMNCLDLQVLVVFFQIYEVLGNYYQRFLCMQLRENNEALRTDICRFAKRDIVHLACRLRLMWPAIATRAGSSTPYVCQRHDAITEAAEGFRAFDLFANDFIPALVRYINQTD